MGPQGSEKVVGSEVIRRERSAGPTALGDAPPVSAAAAAAGGGARLCPQGLARGSRKHGSRGFACDAGAQPHGRARSLRQRLQGSGKPGHLGPAAERRGCGGAGSSLSPASSAAR